MHNFTAEAQRTQRQILWLDCRADQGQAISYGLYHHVNRTNVDVIIMPQHCGAFPERFWSAMFNYEQFSDMLTPVRSCRIVRDARFRRSVDRR